MRSHYSAEAIERLALERLTTAELIRAQRHLFNCGDCLKHLLEIEYKLALEEVVLGNGSPGAY